LTVVAGTCRGFNRVAVSGPKLPENRAREGLSERILAAGHVCQPRFYVAAKKCSGALDIEETAVAAVQRLALLLLGKNRPMVAGYACGDRLAFGTSRFCIINREAQ
jgi:hypothetical protein